MKYKIKRGLAICLIAVLLVAAIPIHGICTEVDALQKMAEFCQEQEIPGTEQTEPGSEDISDSVQIVTEEETDSEQTTEAEDMTEITTTAKVQAEAEKVTEEKTDVTTRVILPEMLTNSEQIVTLASDAAPLGVILAAGAWTKGHYKWYVNVGGANRHYIFCLEKGKVMKSNTFKPKKYSGKWGSTQNTFRIAVAMDYFKKQGGWSSEEGYETAQQVIWNEGGNAEAKALLKYIEYLWRVTEKNEERKSGSGSYSSLLTPISKADAKDNASRKKLNVKAKKVALTGNDQYDVKTTLKLGGSAWKYFAQKGGYGSLEVQGCYQADGSKLGDNIAKASLDSSGNLTVQTQLTYNQQEIATNDKNAVMVIVKVNPKYEGATKINYLKTTYSSNQTLSYDAEFASPAYFAVKVYATSTVQIPTGILANKIDEFGQVVDGAQFGLYKMDEPDLSFKKITVAEGDYTEIEKTGSYMLVEEKAPEGLSLYTNSRGDHTVAYFEVKSRMVGTVQQLYIVPTKTFENVTAISSEDAMTYTYTVTDSYKQGDAYLHKIANAFVAFENGRFIYQKRDLAHVTFELYAAEDIYAQDICLFEADQQITNDLLSDSIWNTKGKHNGYIEEQTDENGYIRYCNLPCGRYYVIEKVTDSNEAYWVSGERIYFDIEESGKDNAKQIHEGDGYWNNPVKAQCMVVKEDDKGKHLKGAEFTLYAHIENTNFFGAPLFTGEQTQPVVISRINGYKRVSEDEWIPIATMESNEDGEAYFNLDLPYGKYLVAETQPPKDEKTGKRYELAKETYTFEHSPDEMESFASGALFQHVFTDEKVGNFILIRKTGELLSRAETVQTEHGAYKKLIYEPLAAANVTFEIRNLAGEIVDRLTTNEYGEVRSKDLKPGTYYVREIRNGGLMKKDEKEKEVVIGENLESAVQIQEVDFVNTSLATRFRIYKQAERVERNRKEVIADVSSADALYNYTCSGIAGVVFGIYTKDDIKNAAGTVIVKADSCVGYTVTDDNGLAVFTEALTNGNYYYKECKTADDSFIKDEKTYPFQIELNGEDVDRDLNKEDPVINQKIKGSIRIIKTDSVTKKALTGVHFTLYDAQKEPLGDFVTDEEGKINIKNLPLGCYYLQETQTLEEYILDSDMQEIVLKKGYVDVELDISNDHKKESLQGGKDDHIRKNKMSGTAKTGDVPIAIVFIILGMAVLFLLVLYKWKEVVQRMKKLGKWIGILSLMVACMIPARSLKAAGLYDENINAGETSVTIDGRREYADVRFVKEYNGFRMTIYCEDAVYESEQCYTVNKNDNIEETDQEYILEKTEADRENPTSFTLTRTESDKSFTVPKVIEVAGRVTYYSANGAVSQRDIQLAEKGTIRKIQYDQMMNLVIEEDSCVEEVEWRMEQSGLGILESLNAVHLTCYKQNVNGEIRGGSNYVFRKADVDSLQNSFCLNVKVRYDSELAKALRFPCLVVNENDQIETVKLEPGYVNGRFIYEQNGGRFESESYIDTYIRGKDSVAEQPVRKDYAFAGWYFDSNLSDEKKLQQDETGRYYITAEQAKQSRCTLYAKWIYSAYVERKDMTFHIGTEQEAELIANTNLLEADIPDKIAYGGKEYPVTKIAKNAFENATIQKVTIASSVKYIDPDAFSNCKNLQQVYMNGMNLTLGKCFPQHISLYAYEESMAYKKYEEEGYTGAKNAYASQITYVLNGGQNAVDNPTKYCWKSYLLLKPAVKAGYRFDGWYKDSSFQKASLVKSIQKDQYVDIVLYAKFTPLKSDTKPEETIVGSNTDGQGTTESMNPGATTQEQPANKKPKIQKITIKVKKSGRVTLKITAKQAKGYCVEYATNKKLKHRKTAYLSKNTHTFTKWKRKKTYYIRICPYQYDENGRRVYGAFTKVYKVKTK